MEHIDVDIVSLLNESAEEDDLDVIRRAIDGLERARQLGDPEEEARAGKRLVEAVAQVVTLPSERGSLAQERERVMRDRFLAKGTSCRACGQRAQVYSLPFSANNAISLVWLKRHDDLYPGEYVHVPSREFKFMGKDGEFSRMVHWGLIEQEPHPKDSTKRRPGRWRITSLGRKVAAGGAKVRERFVRYDSNLLGFDGPEIYIHQAVPFDYGDLWKVDLTEFARAHGLLVDAHKSEKEQRKK